MENTNPFNELTIVEKYDFIGKLVIAAENGYFGECSGIVNKAQEDGLFERVKPLLEGSGNTEIKDLDNPIGNTTNY